MLFKLEEGEKVLRIVRKHWLSIVLEFFSLFIVAVLPFMFFVMFRNVIFYNLAVANVFILWFFYTLFLIVVWILGFILWTNYYLDMWVITNKRIIDVDQKGLFYRDVTSIRLDKIQDIKIVIPGIINTIIGIGNIHIQTASANKNFVIRQADNPELVKQIIAEAQNKEEERAQVVKIQS